MKGVPFVVPIWLVISLIRNSHLVSRQTPINSLGISPLGVTARHRPQPKAAVRPGGTAARTQGNLSVMRAAGLCFGLGEVRGRILFRPW